MTVYLILLTLALAVCIVVLFKYRPQPRKSERKPPATLSDDTQEIPLLEYSFRANKG